MNFVDLRKEWDYVSSVPIGTKKQRTNIAKQIRKNIERNWVVRCFPDSKQYVWVCSRMPRLMDYT